MIAKTQGVAQALEALGRMDNSLERLSARDDSPARMAEGIGETLSNAIAELDQSQKAADAGALKLLAGEPVDLHQVMLQMEESFISLNLALQVRNRVIEAYQEIQRMQI